MAKTGKGYAKHFKPGETPQTEIYNLTVGDDGPTDTNSYDGYVRVYALTCNAEGVLENENT